MKGVGQGQSSGEVDTNTTEKWWSLRPSFFGRHLPIYSQLSYLIFSGSAQSVEVGSLSHWLVIGVGPPATGWSLGLDHKLDISIVLFKKTELLFQENNLRPFLCLIATSQYVSVEEPFKI